MEQRIPQTVAMRRGAVEEEVIPSIARFSSLKDVYKRQILNYWMIFCVSFHIFAEKRKNGKSKTKENNP